MTGNQPLAVQMMIHQLLVIGIQFVGKLYGTIFFISVINQLDAQNFVHQVG